MGLYCLGMRFSFGLGRASPCPDHVLFGKYFSFLGFLVFWFESLFLGLGDLFSGSFLLLKLENRYLSVKFELYLLILFG